MLPVTEELFTQVGQWGHFAGDAGPNELVIDDVIAVSDDVTKRYHLHRIRNLCKHVGKVCSHPAQGFATDLEHAFACRFRADVRAVGFKRHLDVKDMMWRQAVTMSYR